MDFTIIAAMDQNRGIGINNDLPWHLSEDLKHFKKTTTGGTVIMGRRTWESIPEKYRPFKERLNVVLTRSKSKWDLDLPHEVQVAGSIDEALAHADALNPDQAIFIIGGAQIFAQAIEDSFCTRLILTEIESTFDCDVTFPEIPEDFKKTSESEMHEEKGIKFRFVTYERG